MNVVNNIHDVEFPTIRLRVAKTKEQLIELAPQADVIILLGWSWKVPDHVVNNKLVVGIHPSDLPRYAGGSPIQHQIRDGLTLSIVTLFRVTENFDEGDVLGKCPFSLEGDSLNDIFVSITNASTTLVKKFIKDHPQHDAKSQSTFGEGFYRKRLKPENSQLTREDLTSLTSKQLYDRIRCVANDEYPNAYIEDETGRLLIKSVEFKNNKQVNDE